MAPTEVEVTGEMETAVVLPGGDGLRGTAIEAELATGAIVVTGEEDKWRVRKHFEGNKY